MDNSCDNGFGGCEELPPGGNQEQNQTAESNNNVNVAGDNHKSYSYGNGGVSLGAIIASGVCGRADGLSLNAGSIFGGVGFGKQNVDPNGVSAPFTALEYVHASLEDRQKMFDSLSDDDKPVMNCLANIYQDRDETRTQETWMKFSTHGLDRKSNAPGERKGASVEEHTAVQLTAMEKDPKYKEGFIKTFNAREQFSEAHGEATYAKPSDLLRIAVKDFANQGDKPVANENTATANENVEQVATEKPVQLAPMGGYNN